MNALNESKVNEFCNMVFRVVDTLDHWPISLSSKEATPTKLEKYPRLLFGYLQRYDDPVSALREWESKLLRDTSRDDNNTKKISVYNNLQKLEQWLVRNDELFDKKTKKVLIRHLRGSLYARVFGYMYPRRAIISEVVDILREDGKDLDYGIEHFDEIVEKVEMEAKEIRDRVSKDEWQVIVKDARQKLMTSKNYYKKVLNDREDD